MILWMFGEKATARICAIRIVLLIVLSFCLGVGCVAWRSGMRKDFFVSSRHGFRIRLIKGEPWRRTPEAADILALNDPSTSVLYFDNRYSGGVISLQVVATRFASKGTFLDELKFIYRQMLSAPHNDMRTVDNGKFAAFDEAVRIRKKEGVDIGEFYLKGAMGRRPSALSREIARQRYEAAQPFAGPRTPEELKEERERRSQVLTPAYIADYRGKVVVYLRQGTLYEFYYIDHALAFEHGLQTFDAFVESLEFSPGSLLERVTMGLMSP